MSSKIDALLAISLQVSTIYSMADQWGRTPTEWQAIFRGLAGIVRHGDDTIHDTRAHVACSALPLARIIVRGGFEEGLYKHSVVLGPKNFFKKSLLHVQHLVHIRLGLAQAQRQPAEPGCDCDGIRPFTLTVVLETVVPTGSVRTPFLGSR